MAVESSPWMNTTDAAKYLKRGKRFILREIHAGRLRAAIVGGRREVLTSIAWLDQWVSDQATPIALRRRAG
jgi:excisionase family DNA binding protein